MFGKEIAKIFRNKVCLLGIIVLLVAQAILLVWEDSNRHGYSPEEYNKVWKEIEKQAGQKSIDEICEQMQLTIKINRQLTVTEPDRVLQKNTELFSDIVAELQAIQSVNGYRRNVLENGKKLLRFSKNGSMSSFTKKDIEKTIQVYEKLPDCSGKVESYRAVSLFMGERYPVILLLIFAMFLCYLLFLSEKEQGTLVLTRTCLRGRKQLARVKTEVLFIGILGMMTVMYFLRFCILEKRYGFGDFSACIRTIPGFERCRFSLTVWEYFATVFCLRFVVICACAAVFAWLSVAFADSVLCVGSSLLIMVVQVLMYIGVKASSVAGIFHFLNLWGMLRYDAIGSYINLNIFGKPVECLLCVIVLSLLVIAAAVTGCIKKYAGIETLTKKLKIKLPLIFQRKSRVGLFAMEAKRFLIECPVILIALVLLIFQVNKYKKQSSDIFITERIYKTYMERLEGTYTEEKENFLKKEMDAVEEIIQTNPFEANRYEMQRSAILMAQERLEHVKNTKRGELFWDYGYRNLFEAYDVKTMLLEMLTAVVLVLFCASFLFAPDVSNGMLHLLRTTANRKKDTRYRLIFGAVEAFVITAIVILPNLIHQLAHFGVQGMTKPADSIIALKSVGNIPLWVFIILFYVMRFLGVFLVSVAACCFAFWTKSTAVTVLLGLSTFCAIPMLVLLEPRLRDLLVVYSPILGNDILGRSTVVAVTVIVIYVVSLIMGIRVIAECGGAYGRKRIGNR